MVTLSRLRSPLPSLSPPPRTRIDLRVPRVASTPSEYAELERQITEDLESGAGALEGADERVIGEVADWLARRS